MAKMSNMDNWFPKADSQPISIRDAWANVSPPERESDISRFAIGEEWRKLKQGQKSSKYLSLIRPRLDLPSPTITKGVGTTASLASVTHPLECRKYSTHEGKRVASFPDSYRFAGDWGDCLERIGNSVPPLFMYSIARNIKSMLQTGQPYRQENTTKKIEYPAHLAMMWEKAIAPRADDAPTVISTFAGGGGSSTGYMMAGYRELLAVEWDDNAVQTLRLNYPHLDIYHGDIAKLSVEEVLQRTGLQPGELDVFDGSPPCQGFSTAGKRDFDDDRNQLFREYVRLLRGLQPKVFVMENVSGMVKGKMKLIFVEILKELKASGYKVSARLLNAMYFHVPQSRQRIIFIGVRDDLGIEPSHPKAESQPITPRIAFSDCQNGVLKNLSQSMADAAKLMKPGNYSGSNAERAFQKARGKTSGAINTKLLSWDRASCTLPKSVIAETGIIHPDRERYLTIDEAKRIGESPDSYKLEGDYKTQWARIGNSVPPLFMEAIARNIRAEILSKI
jgi:DNA (cytosine-5)-methyltransferase 1